MTKKTPFQQRRKRRNDRIYEEYNSLTNQGYGTMTTCDIIASKFKLSISTVYTVVRSWRQQEERNNN